MVIKKIKKEDVLRLKIGKNISFNRKIYYRFVIKKDSHFEEWTGLMTSVSEAEEWYNTNGKFWEEKGYELYFLRTEKTYNYDEDLNINPFKTKVNEKEEIKS